MLKGNRTRLFGLLVLLMGVLEQLTPDTISQVVPPEYQGSVVAGIGILVIILRQITSTPPGKSN